MTTTTSTAPTATTATTTPFLPRIHPPLPRVWLLWREDDQPKIVLQNLVAVQKLLYEAGKYLYGEPIKGT